jgi:NosR/NirI family transcriptional regulator, nitrous oxide reductase regulator
LKKLAVLTVLVGNALLVAVAAERILTNANPDAHLRKLFPTAVAFSPLAGDPLHFNAYTTDPRATPAARPIGYAFWTTDLLPQEHGYHGPIHMLVGMDLTGTLTGVIVDYDTEPYGYFSVEPPKFGAQFKGKSIRDPFRVGADVDAVSRASISINSAARVIKESARMVAKQLLPPDAAKP